MKLFALLTQLDQPFEQIFFSWVNVYYDKYIFWWNTGLPFTFNLLKYFRSPINYPSTLFHIQTASVLKLHSASILNRMLIMLVLYCVIHTMGYNSICFDNLKNYQFKTLLNAVNTTIRKMYNPNTACTQRDQ